MPFVNQVYINYIRSAEWKAKRLQVLTRDKYLCQVCKKKLATQVHHKTYARFGHELLEDLLSACRSCHGILSRLSRPRPQFYDISTAPDPKPVTRDP
jgi:5-methylcytosine-specific restriction endonuclease McrA